MNVGGFMKVRNEILREGNIYRALANLERVCDGGVLCDDASTDGTREVLEAYVAKNPQWSLVLVEPVDHNFERELEVKERMLSLVHQRSKTEHAFDWIWWLDADETLDAEGTEHFRSWLERETATVGSPWAWRFHYTQLWRNCVWARTDDGFDNGQFLKLWRYSPALHFDTSYGTHRQQFPRPLDYQRSALAPFEIIHWGNYGKNLQWKSHQYAGGLGGVDRHLFFGHSTPSLASGKGYDTPMPAPSPSYRRVPAEIFPPGTRRDGGDMASAETPRPFTLDEVRLIREMGNLTGKKGWFTVVVPTFNRAADLPRTLASLRAQSYQHWVALVLDDGSTDETTALMRRLQDEEPRIFYARYPENRGGVAMNEIGMAMACEMTEYWTRLGSDDTFGPDKLAYDAQALDGSGKGTPYFGACYGSYRVSRRGQLAESCNPSLPLMAVREALQGGRFVASWANIAVRTAALRKVRNRWGNFVDPSLRNQEDFLFNARLSLETDFVWRGLVRGELLVNPSKVGVHSEDIEAVWNCLENVGAPPEASASANAVLTGQETELTRRLIAEFPR